MFTGRLFGTTVAILWPSMMTSPEVGVSKPANMRRSVVLPQPDGPRRAKNSPRLTVRLTLSTALTPPGKILERFLISMIGDSFCSGELPF